MQPPCNVSIMRSIMTVFNKKCCLYFENLNMHIMSHRIPIYFISAQWPDIFCKFQSVYQQINCMLHNRDASIARRVANAFASWSNSFQYPVILAELVMVGSAKLMVGHRPQQAYVGLATPLHITQQSKSFYYSKPGLLFFLKLQNHSLY